MCAVQNVAMLIVARVVNGFAVGMLTSQGYVVKVFSRHLEILTYLNEDLYTLLKLACRTYVVGCFHSSNG